MGVPLAVGSSLRYGSAAMSRRTLHPLSNLVSSRDAYRQMANIGGLDISLITRGFYTG